MTPTHREVMQQALEALDSDNPEIQLRAAMSLRAALVEPVQEPVAWMHNEIEDNIITHRPASIDRHPERWTALYKEPPEHRKPLTDEETLWPVWDTGPTNKDIEDAMRIQRLNQIISPHRKWVGLTEDEIDRLWGDPQQGYWDYRKFARTIEAKLKEKNT